MTSASSDEPAGSPVAPASLPRRMGAVLYEGLLVFALVLTTGFALLPITPGAGAHALSIPRPAARAVSFVAIALVVGFYCVHFWTAGRRTLPMKTWHIALVRGDATPLDVRTALVRYAAAWIGPMLAIAAYVALREAGHARQGFWLLAFNYAYALFDRDRLFLHDRIAGTRLVTAPARPR